MAHLPWLAASSSRFELDSSSSTSVLQGIYGSQASSFHQFTTDSGSEASISHAEIDSWPKSHKQNRPKSSPVSALVEREQRRALVRPGSALVLSRGSSRQQSRGRLLRPTSAAPFSSTRSVQGMPQRRPSTAAHHRPSSARPVSQISRRSSLVQLGSLSETAPVTVSYTPQYFGFWNEKPILKKEFVVPVHKRRPWKRSSVGSHQVTAGGGNDRSKTGSNGGMSQDASAFSQYSGIETGGGFLDDHNRGLNSSHSRGSGMGEESEDNMKRNSSGGSDQLTSNLNSEDSTGGHGYGDEGNSDVLSSNDVGDYTNWRHNDTTSDDGNIDDLSQLGNIAAVSDNHDGAGDLSGDNYFKMRSQPSTSWLEDSMGSSNTTRFNLPVDLMLLESMTPAQYLHSYCCISHRRTSYYSKVFGSLDRNNDRLVSVKEMLEGLVVAHYQCLTEEQADSVVNLLHVGKDHKVDLQLFGATCVLAERLYPDCLPHSLHKEIIEVVDFQGLDWKLRNCTINNQLSTIFTKL